MKILAVLTAVALLAIGGCGGAGGKPPEKGSGRDGASVTIGRVETRPFIDKVEAIGTAYAQESVTLASNITERVKSLHFRDGGPVRKGQVVVRLDEGEETANLAEAQSQLKQASLQLDRLRTLAGRGYATQAQLEQQIAARDAAAATVAATRARIADRIILAPFSGIAGLRRVSPGVIVQAGTPIIEITDISRIKLDFTVPESMLRSLATGQPIKARAAAFNRVFTGVVDSIDPQVDPVTRAVTVRALLPNPDRQLKPGMLLSVSLEGRPRTSLAIPEQALSPRLDRQFVYLYDPASKTVHERQVRTGSRQPGFVEIVSGLSEGQQIVVEGTVKLNDGDKVKPLGGAPDVKPSALANAGQPSPARAQ